MLLADPNEIRAELGFEDMVDITDAITGALNAASAILASRLGTSFDEAERVDMFYVNEPGFSQGASVQTEFRLTQGFVSEVTSIGYTSSLEVGSDVTDVIGVAIVEKELGRIRDFTTRYNRGFVRVEYKAGFPKADGQTGANPVADTNTVPDWLMQAAKLKALLLVSGTPPLEQAQIKLDTKTLASEFEAIVSSKVRYMPVALLAL